MPNSVCGLIFHKKEDAVEKFRTKILYAYDRLPGWLRAELPYSKRDESSTLELANGSRIVCTASGRGSRFQYLHISELGPMVATFPARAEEVVSGALNTVGPSAFVTIESTAMGSFGDFWERCTRAEALDKAVQAGTRKLTRLDYKFFFFAWWQDARNVLPPEDVAEVPISDDLAKYFAKVEDEMGCRLFPAQRAWYAKKLEEQKFAMKREHPSTPAEAFEGSIEGAFYGTELAVLEREGRICHLPHLPHLPVYTFWDIGRRDATAIWFMQKVGPWYHFLKYYENANKGVDHYQKILTKFKDELGYRYGTHYLPHDGANTDWTQSENKTRKEVVEDMKLGDVEIVKRVEHLMDGIEMTRQMLAQCKFDYIGCGETEPGSGRGGLMSLRAYRAAYDEPSKTWSDGPVKSWANHGSDAIRQCAQAFDRPDKSDKPTPSTSSRKRATAARSGMTA